MLRFPTPLVSQTGRVHLLRMVSVGAVIDLIGGSVAFEGVANHWRHVLLLTLRSKLGDLTCTLTTGNETNMSGTERCDT